RIFLLGGRRRRGTRLAAIAQMHRLRVAHGDTAQILRRVFRPAHDVRDQRDHQFLAITGDALAGEQSVEDRNAGQPRDAGPALGLLVLGEAAQKLHRAIGHADIVRDFALPDDRLVDAARGDVARDTRNAYGHVHRDIVVVMHAAEDFHVDADVEEGELRIDQGVDAHAADAWLETAGGDGLAVADL